MIIATGSMFVLNPTDDEAALSQGCNYYWKICHLIFVIISIQCNVCLNLFCSHLNHDFQKKRNYEYREIYYSRIIPFIQSIICFFTKHLPVNNGCRERER